MASMMYATGGVQLLCCQFEKSPVCGRTAAGSLTADGRWHVTPGNGPPRGLSGASRDHDGGKVLCTLSPSVMPPDRETETGSERERKRENDMRKKGGRQNCPHEALSYKRTNHMQLARPRPGALANTPLAATTQCPVLPSCGALRAWLVGWPDCSAVDLTQRTSGHGRVYTDRHCRPTVYAAQWRKERDRA